MQKKKKETRIPIYNKVAKKITRQCSFCGRTESEVNFLITGMNGFICDSCVQQAYEIVMAQTMADSKNKAKAKFGNITDVPKPSEIRKLMLS